MAESVEEREEVPRTDICEECDCEIISEVTKVTGQHELIHQAREAEEGWMTAVGGKVTVTFRCRCGSAKVEYGPGATSAWNIPDGWLWEDDFDA